MLSVDQSNVRMLQRAEHERAEALMMSHRAIGAGYCCWGRTDKPLDREVDFFYIYKGNVRFFILKFRVKKNNKEIQNKYSLFLVLINKKIKLNRKKKVTNWTEIKKPTHFKCHTFLFIVINILVIIDIIQNYVLKIKEQKQNTRRLSV